MADAPPTLVEAIAECIEPDRLAKPVDGVLRLREKPAKMQFEVVDSPASIAAIHMEKVGHLPGVREGHLKKVCDYLLVAQIHGQSHAVFIEMKKPLTHEESPKEQLVRSKPILRYLRSMCTVEYGFPNSASRTIAHFWIIGEKFSKYFDKQHVRANPRGRIVRISHKGTNIAMFVGPRMRFAELAEA